MKSRPLSFPISGALPSHYEDLQFEPTPVQKREQSLQDGDMANKDMDPFLQSLIERMRRSLGSGGGDGMTSMVRLTTGGGEPVRQTQRAPDGLEFCEDVSPGRWVEESLSGFARLHSLLPG